MTINLVWIRNDLRICDNPALYFACKNTTAMVLTLFIATPEQWKINFMAPRKALLIYKNLNYLKNEIIELGIAFHYYESTNYNESIDYLVYFCKKFNVDSVFFNYEYGFYEQQRDHKVKLKLADNEILVRTFHDSILFKPGSITNKQGIMYKKYSFFKKKYIKNLNLTMLRCFPKPLKKSFNNNFSKFDLPIFNYPTKTFNEDFFPVGEQLVLKKLKYFAMNKLNKYCYERNIPELNSTSMLSAHLSIGVLTTRQCIYYLLNQHYINFNRLISCSWINELIWREFYRHLLYFYPQLSQQSCLSKWETNIKWKNNSRFFNAWKEGKTGYPIIDAGMKQLHQIGWMHNRLRMIAASFLVKNLCIDWRKGEKYFMSQLIDGDIASNSGGWQWIASVGTDSMPYFRIFNPILQAKKFDPKKNFVYQYIPELNTIENSKINSVSKSKKNNINNYKILNPIVDYFYSKKTTLTMFRNAKK